jgi:BlaI family penicillinase repressor
MPSHARDVTDAELSVMQALWRQGPSTIRKLAEAIYRRDDPSHYATVQKLLERLTEKGYVSRDRSGAVHVFSAVVGRDDLVGRRLRELAESLCGGSWAPILTQLVEAEGLTRGERQSLRSLVERLDADARNKGGTKRD